MFPVSKSRVINDRHISMEFRTQIPVSESSNPIDYNSKVVSLGSCFAENISEKFHYFKFQATTNPFGIIFNPVSLSILIKRIVAKDYFAEKDVFFLNGRWHCFDVHSELSLPDKEAYLDRLNRLIDETYQQLSEATHVIITYGTSWVYRKKGSLDVVASCHKVPQKEFEKDLLAIESIQTSTSKIIEMIQAINPDCHFTFTVSPVRHIKDGFAENQLSKAHLFAGLHTVIGSLSASHYFPSYEIMMDELRDYRFYAEDMLHPNQTAIDYIWKLFAEAHFSAETFSTMALVENIQRAIHHRPFDEHGVEHQNFLSNLQDKIKKVQQKVPHIHF